MNPEMLTREGISNEPGWHTRLREEYNNLKDRYEKLHRAIVTIEAGTCDFRPKCDIDLLKKQAKAICRQDNLLERCEHCITQCDKEKQKNMCEHILKKRDDNIEPSYFDKAEAALNALLEGGK